MSSVDFSLEVDREYELLAITIDYVIDGYYDPETGEYFGDTSWTVHVTDLDSGLAWSMGNYAAEGDSVWFDLGTGTSPGLRRHAIEFSALNTFSADSIALGFTALTDAHATVPLSITGTDGRELIVGGFAADTLAGGGGADLLEAGGGNDVLEGGTGDDRLIGGAGADTVSGNAGDDVYRIDDRRDRVVELAGEGRDTVVASVSVALAANVEVLQLTGIAAIGGTGNGLANQISGNLAANLLAGAGGADSLQGGGGGDTLDGGGGNDTLDGGSGDDSLVGGAGNDSYLIGPVPDAVLELAGGGIDTVIGTGLARYVLADGVENFITRSAYVFAPPQAIDLGGNALDNGLVGGGGADSLHGAAGADRLDGGDGDDLLDGGTGADILRGGAGRDTASYADALDAVAVDLRGGTGSAGEADGDVLRAIEDLLGGAGADTLGGSGTGNRLDGGAGDDSLAGAGGNDTLSGGAGADTLDGGAGRDFVSYAGSGSGALRVDLAAGSITGADGDVISGIESLLADAGNDTLLGSADGNLLAGGAGDDSIDGADGDDTIAGGSGGDLLAGGAGDGDVLSYAGSVFSVTVQLESQSVAGGDAEGDSVSGFEAVVGGRGGDTLEGTAGSDSLWGGGGADLLEAGDGDDLVDGGAGGDTLSGGAGIDTLSYAGTGATVVVYLADGTAYYGHASGDVIDGFEQIVGGRAGDYLVGDAGANRLWGGGGHDALDGGGGDDVLVGGAGDDNFIFHANAGNDTVRGFGGGDTISLDLGPAWDSYEEIMAAAQAGGPNGEDTLLDFGAAGTILLVGVAPGTLMPEDFLL